MKSLFFDCSAGIDEYAIFKVLAEYAKPKDEILPLLNETFKVVGTQTDINAWIDSCNVSDEVKNDMKAIAHSLQQAGIQLDPKSWVMLGSIVYLFRHIRFEQVLSSPVNVLSGTEAATARLLEGAKVKLSYEGKGCSYLAAALLKHFVDAYGDMPVLELEQSLSAETLNHQVVNAYVGELEESLFASELVCNLDDMTPEELANVEAILYDNGAYDVYLTNIHMKKNRPGQMLTCMCDSKDKEKFLELIFKNTTTLGVREYSSKRYVLDHKTEEKDTAFGKVHVKTAEGYGTQRSKFEFDDLASIAKKENLTIQEVKERLK